jgi:monoterpene epsilon-lactone hydrolase
VLFSPWTDLAGTGDSLRGNARRDPMFQPQGIPSVAAWYLNGADPRTPEASPLYAALGGLPPLLIEVGEREMLRDDSTRLAARAQADGVNVTLTIWPVVPHVWQLARGFVPEARQSLQKAAAFLHRHAGAADAAPGVAAKAGG